MASASTKRESAYSSSPSLSCNSDEYMSDSDMAAVEHNYPEQPEAAESLR